jgi:hypothetical protein
LHTIQQIFISGVSPHNLVGLLTPCAPGSDHSEARGSSSSPCGWA